MSRQRLLRMTVFTLLAILPVFLSACQDASQQQNRLTPVRYVEVREQRVVQTTELPGRVSAFMTSEVRPQVTGIIQARLFEEGADVEAGQILYQIDPALFQAAYNNAEANLKKALANEVSTRLLAQRYGKIIKSNAVSRQEHDDAVSAHVQAQAAVEAARQALETARINLDYTKITAPVRGRIGRSFVTSGALVIQNQPQPLAVIQHIDSVYVDISQSSTAILRLRRALAEGALLLMGVEKAKVKLKMEDGTPYARPRPDAPEGSAPDWIEGELLFADVTIDKSAGGVNIRAKLDNPAKALLPGMYVRAIFDVGVIEDAILVPQRAVMLDTDGSAFVYVLQKDQNAQADSDVYTVAQRTVTIGGNYGTKWRVSAGLVPGDLLMVEGHLKTRPGNSVAGTATADPQPAAAETLSALSHERTRMR